MIELKPEDTYLTRAWLVKHGWVPTKEVPLMADNPDDIDADLCAAKNRKEYMIAKFHLMAERAWDPSAMPYSFDVVGADNSVELTDYDHARLVMAAVVCGLAGDDKMDAAIGGKYMLTIDDVQYGSPWKPITEWPKDGERILMKLSNGKYQYGEWEADGKGFGEGFTELQFGGGVMMRLPVSYQVEAWRTLEDVIEGGGGR